MFRRVTPRTIHLSKHLTKHSSRSMSIRSFNLPNTEPPVPVRLLTPDVGECPIIKFPAFNNWVATLQQSLALQHSDPRHQFHSDPYVLRSIDIQSADFFDNRLGFLKIKAYISNEKGETLPGVAFLRGGSMAILLLLKPVEGPPDQPSKVVLVVQPRVPASSLSFVELPAGMIDMDGSFSGAAAKEIREETGFIIRAEDLIDMTALAADDQVFPEAKTIARTNETLPKAVFPSPGGSDEYLPIFVCQKEVLSEELREMQGRMFGLRDKGERIRVEIVNLDDLWRVACRDAKALVALSLYKGLKADGRLPEHI